MKKLNGFYAVGLGVAMLGAVSASAAETVYESSNSRSKPAFGVQAGINFDTATTPNQINSNTHTGFTVGLALDMSNPPSWASNHRRTDAPETAADASAPDTGAPLRTMF